MIDEKKDEQEDTDKKGESDVNIEVMKDDDWDKLLALEEEFIKDMCAKIIALKPDVVITEKGLSDLAQHFLIKANISCIRRIRKTDNNRVARACGATICNRIEEALESDIGTKAGLFEIRKIADEYFTFIEECDGAKACTILLRGASKDVLNYDRTSFVQFLVNLDNFIYPNSLIIP